MVCEAEQDFVWWLFFPATLAGFSHSRQCPQNGTGTTSGISLSFQVTVLMCMYEYYIGTVNRFCTFEGVWEAVNTDSCTRDVISSLNNTVRL